uniref:Alpha-1,3-mannosyl-glycoprotein 2-beta-N-acetylglucosaminyltransferase n=1 Tax=Steinernema glaseri TaxID=37863 RepID=A0A1I7XXH2_9BILA
MLTASVWKELSSKWPEAYWDDWLRRPEVRNGRACIRPEVSRTAHNMKVAGKGSSNGLYKTFLTSIHLPDSPVDFSKVNVDALRKREYDINLVAILRNATLLSFEQLDGVLDTNTIYKIIYQKPRDFRSLAKKYKLMSDIRSGMARTAYYGIVPFMISGSRVYAVHGRFDETLLLSGASSSVVYTQDWDRMNRFLEFEELYCKSGKWTGKCDPADPGMINWFKKRNRMRLLNSWTDVIVN